MDDPSVFFLANLLFPNRLVQFFPVTRSSWQSSNEVLIFNGGFFHLFVQFNVGVLLAFFLFNSYVT